MLEHMVERSAGGVRIDVPEAAGLERDAGLDHANERVEEPVLAMGRKEFEDGVANLFGGHDPADAADDRVGVYDPEVHDATALVTHGHLDTDHLENRVERSTKALLGRLQRLLGLT